MASHFCILTFTDIFFSFIKVVFVLHDDFLINHISYATESQCLINYVRSGVYYSYKRNYMYRQREVSPNLKSYSDGFNCTTLTDQVEIFICLRNI